MRLRVWEIWIAVVCLGVQACGCSRGIAQSGRSENSQKSELERPINQSELMERCKRLVGAIAELGRARKGGASIDAERLREILNVDGSGYFEEEMTYYGAVLDLISKNREGAKRNIARAIGDNINIPDVLLLSLRGVNSEDDQEDRDDTFRELGRILPMSEYSKMHSGVDRLVFVNIPRNYGDDYLIRIGELYQGMRLCREAANVYLEALYSSGVDHVSEANIWFRIAQMESMLGQKRLAIRAFMKAAYCERDDDDLGSKIEGIVSMMLANGGGGGYQTSVRREDMLEIARLYVQHNAHPYALIALKQAENISGEDYSAERQQIEDQWIEVIRGLARGSDGNVRIFGVLIRDVVQWDNVRILRPSETFWVPSDGDEVGAGQLPAD